jgi:enoyl-CoA hydratase/carnithine racemase
MNATAHSVTTDVRAGVATICFARPPVNALTAELVEELASTVLRSDESDQVRVIVLSGAGTVFSAGFDVHRLRETPPDSVRRRNAGLVTQYARVAAARKPVIAAVDGYALGGGLELALCCDLRVVATDALVGFPEVGLGGVPGIGGMQRLTRQVGLSKAKQLVLTGHRLSGEEAHRIGLADQTAPPHGAAAFAEELAREIAEHSAVAVMSAKHAMNHGRELPLLEAMALDLDAVDRVAHSPERITRLMAFGGAGHPYRR